MYLSCPATTSFPAICWANYPTPVYKEKVVAAVVVVKGYTESASVQHDNINISNINLASVRTRPSLRKEKCRHIPHKLQGTQPVGYGDAGLGEEKGHFECQCI